MYSKFFITYIIIFIFIYPANQMFTFHTRIAVQLSPNLLLCDICKFLFYLP